MILKLTLSLELSKLGNYLVKQNVGWQRSCGPAARVRAQRAKLAAAFGSPEGAQSRWIWG